MEIITEEYSIKYDVETATIYWQGILRLTPKEYKPISHLLNQVVAQPTPRITLHLRELNMINSFGISVIGQFVRAVANKKTIQLIIQGNEDIVWQTKSLKNFQRLMPQLQLEWE